MKQRWYECDRATRLFERGAPCYHHCVATAGFLCYQRVEFAVESDTDGPTVDCIDHIEQSKKSGRPMTISLRPNFDLLAQLKALHILFLDDNGETLTYGFVDTIG